jgi:8-oxo-dGTP diphosphatase
VTNYVAGFALSENFRDTVLLVRKNQPAWQKDMLNGVGGKMEANETPEEAMVREFQEETGIHVAGHFWREHLHLISGEHHIWFFSTELDDNTLGLLHEKLNDVGEKLFTVAVQHINQYITIPNLQWIVPLVAYKHDKYGPFVVREWS